MGKSQDERRSDVKSDFEKYFWLFSKHFLTSSHCTLYARTDPHLIAWFSAGAFVLLGFPISMWGIVSHLANYNQPHVQVYVVRILWMVPIYSVERYGYTNRKGLVYD